MMKYSELRNSVQNTTNMLPKGFADMADCTAAMAK